MASSVHGLAAQAWCLGATTLNDIVHDLNVMKLFAVSLHGNLTMSTVLFLAPKYIFHVTPKSTTAKNDDDDPGDDILGLLCLLLPFIRNYLWILLSDMGQLKGLDIYYMDNSAIVVLAYAFLLKINLQYCILVPFPISLVTFIIHLNKIRVKSQHVSGSEGKDGKKSEELVAPTDLSRSKDGSEETDSTQVGELERTVVFPFFMLLISAIYGDSSPVLSHFLLFSCCALGTLALMYSRLADEVTSPPALKPALECIRMSYMVMLFITAHTVAAEWLGEVMALVCMPELIAGLVWFATLLHTDTSKSNRAAVDKVASDKDSISSIAAGVSETEQVSVGIFKGFISQGCTFIPPGAALAGLTTCTFAYDRVLLSSWNTKATVACGVAGCMPYLSIWMISRWPGSIPAADKATQLLKFLANVCFTGACLMLFALPLLAEKTLAYRLFALDALIDPAGVLKYLPFIYFSTAVASLGALFMMK
ncbi:uncharacterized protein LOC120706860 isoform X2 [Panicum virgatum]|uniref:uncharacterized protein LOC120706860 isoform X2 n=1 Tax=Panicum virgatum TaxID=38727 RepID=UPI0019D5F16A|nr:uncharacterized protein LOC120706860 isoform X2 [Panicum virgatum]